MQRISAARKQDAENISCEETVFRRRRDLVDSLGAGHRELEIVQLQHEEQEDRRRRVLITASQIRAVERFMRKIFEKIRSTIGHLIKVETE
jgi:hypothetical protein